MTTATTTYILPPRVAWKTRSMSDDRIEEMKLALESLAGNISCYAGGGIFAHKLRELAKALPCEIAPMP